MSSLNQDSSKSWTVDNDLSKAKEEFYGFSDKKPCKKNTNENKLNLPLKKKLKYTKDVIQMCDIESNSTKSNSDKNNSDTKVQSFNSQFEAIKKTNYTSITELLSSTKNNFW